MCFIPNLLYWSRINLFHFPSSCELFEKKVDFLLQMRGPNWNFRCLDWQERQEVPEGQRGRRNRWEMRKRLKRKKGKWEAKEKLALLKRWPTFVILVMYLLKNFSRGTNWKMREGTVGQFCWRVGGGEGSNFARAVSTATSVRQVMREKETYDLWQAIYLFDPKKHCNLPLFLLI